MPLNGSDKPDPLGAWRRSCEAYVGAWMRLQDPRPWRRIWLKQMNTAAEHYLRSPAFRAAVRSCLAASALSKQLLYGWWRL